LLFSHKKNIILSFVATWVELRDIMLSKISQAQKNKHPMFSPHMWKLQKMTSKVENRTVAIKVWEGVQAREE
jgi:hypothetical protein